MAFDALQSSFPKPFYPTFQRQASMNLGNCYNESVGAPLVPAPGVSLMAQEAVSSMPWFRDACDDPNEVATCTMSNIKSSPNCDEESDLQGLVSSILDEANSHHSYFSEGKQLNCRPLWSPKTQQEELLHCFQSEAKMPNGLAFHLNSDMFPKVFMEADRKEPIQPPNGLLTHQWPPNSLSRPPLRPPPGLPAPRMGNIVLSQMDRYTNMPFEAEPVNTDMNSFGLRYVDVCHPSGAASEQQEAPCCLNPQVSGFQTFHVEKPFQNMNQKMLPNQDGWGAGKGPLMSSPSATLMSPSPRQPLGDGGMQQEEHRDVRWPQSNYEGFPQAPVFRGQSAVFTQQQNQGSAAFIKDKTNFQNHYFNQREKQWMSALTHRPNLRNGERKQRPGLFAVSANMQPLTPLMFPVNDPRGFHRGPANPPIFSTRHTAVYGGPGQHAAAAASEVAAFNLHGSDALKHRGEVSCHRSSARVEEGGAVVQLYFHLDECYEQGNCLEKERKKTEFILSKAFPGKRTADVTNPNIPQVPLSSTRVDHLIANHMKEQAKMINLAYRMECLSNSLLLSNVHAALKKHDTAVRLLHARRKEELANMSKEQRPRAPQAEERDTLLLAAALRDLAAAIRSLRTALWCGLQTTLPEAAGKPRAETPASPASPPLQGYSFNM